MPPISRRKKQYDEQLRGFQNRNFFAGLLLLIFLGLAIWLVINLLPDTKPTVYVSTNYIDHSGSREIPFALESCQLIRDAFGQQLKAELPDVHDVDMHGSALELPKERLGENNVLVVYLNGHLIDRPEADGEQVSAGFLGPEVKLTKKDLGDMLKQIDKSPAKLKLVFLDAGRYSWSPVYPSRPLNKFQSSLAQALQNNRWELSDDFWIITSHSDDEISRVCTPLQSSLFAKAIADSITEMAKSKNSKFEVVELFEKIRQRTTSWSRNFKNQSLQTPVLFHSGTGVVASEQSDESQAEPTFAVTWVVPEEDANADTKPSAEPAYTWQSFDRQDKQAAAQMLAEDFLDAVPFKLLQSIESFVEIGNTYDTLTGSDDYQNALTASQQKPSGNTLFDLGKLDTKQRQTHEFRQAILGMAILNRFQNEMQFWEDDKAINQLKVLGNASNRPDPSGILLNDSMLRTQEKLPAAVNQYVKEFQDYLRLHEELLKLVQRHSLQANRRTNDLTPTQAELLGRASQRYMPLIQAFKPKPKSTSGSPATSDKQNDDSDQGTFALDMEIASSTLKSGSKNGLSIVDLFESATSGISQQQSQQSSDTAYRMLLAVGGSESTQEQDGIVPRISWAPVESKISINSSTVQFRVNPFDRAPIPFSVSAQATEIVNLTLSMDSEETLAGLDFGLNSKFESGRTISFDDGDLSQLRSKDFEVYVGVRNRRPESLLGKPIAMKLTATGADESLEPTVFRFTVQLSRDPTVQLFVRREIGVGETPETEASLVRWGGQLADNWSPLTINSLVNVQSSFQFSLVNNSSRAKTLRAELYNVIDLPADFNDSQIYSDRPEPNQVQEFTSWLSKQQSLPGSPLLRKSYQTLLTLVAETQPIQLPSRGTPVVAQFSVPLPGGKKEPTEASLQPQSVSQGMLLVLYEGESNKPEWFQWLTFEPKEPADATVEKGGDWLKPVADIIDVFQSQPDPANSRQRNKTERLLSKAWIRSGSKDNPEPAAKLTTVSEFAYQQNQHFENTLNLKNIFQEQSLIPNSGDPSALLLLDLLGVPNYGIFELRDNAINQASFRDRLVGIRLKTLPDADWESSPRTWSVVGSSKLLKSNDESLDRDIYIRQPKGATSGQIKIELLLPILKGKVLGKAENDFELTWRNGNVPKLYPNRRQHFVRAGESSLNFWSTVTPHFLTDSSDSFTNESVLEIHHTTGKRQLLGRWRFITRPPPKTGVSVLLSSLSKEFATVEASTTLGQLAQTSVEIDVSRIKPAINLSALKLLVDGTAIKDTAGFLQERSIEKGKFKFPYSDLAEKLGVGKVGVHAIEVNAKTFFGENESATARLEIKPKPKPVKPKPKPVVNYVDVFIEFEDASGKPIGSVDDFKSIIVDRKQVNSAPVRIPKKISASRLYSKGKVSIQEIKEGEHYVQITAVIHDSTFIAQGNINAKKKGEVFKLKLVEAK